MRKTIVVLLSSSAAVVSGLAMVALYSSCGTTSGGTNPAAALGQFVSRSCAPGGAGCMVLQVPNTVPADGRSINGFGLRLNDGSGNPIDGIEICFHWEDPGVATIIEPTDGCGLTDLSGHISGQFVSGTTPGSFQLVADAPPAFGLEARATESFLACPGDPRCNGTSFVAPGAAGAPCSANGDCQSGNFCTVNDPTCFALNACEPPQSNGACCTSSAECQSSSCDIASHKCVAASGSVGAGGACTTGAQCKSGFCSSGTCLGGTGDPCAVSTDCAPTLTCTNGTCNVPPTPTPAPTSTPTPTP